MIKFTTCLFLMSLGLACQRTAGKNTSDQMIETAHADSIGYQVSVHIQNSLIEPKPNQPIYDIKRQQLVIFAKTLLGIPYRYASIDPSKGFDCSGFITYVFNHFNIAVPRSSIDFTNVGTEIELQIAKEGDIILFTGTVDSIRVVGHMGIVTENTDTLKFIHSTSGRANGVTISPLNEHYKKRFVKIIRVLSE